MRFLPQLKVAQKWPWALMDPALLVSAGVGMASYLAGSATLDPARRELLDMSAANKWTNDDFTHSKIHPTFCRQLQARGDAVRQSPTNYCSFRNIVHFNIAKSLSASAFAGEGAGRSLPQK